MKERRAAILCALAAALLAFLVSRLQPVRLVEGAIHDGVLTWSESEARDPRVVVIGIDQASQQVLGPFPWPRSVHARLLRNLRQHGAHAVFFDLVFDAPGFRGTADDAEFASALRQRGDTVLATAVVPVGHRRFQVAPLLPQFSDHAQLGMINRKRDPDGVIRWGILTVAGTEPPALSAALQMFLKTRPPGTVRLTPDALEVGDLEIPTSGSEPHEIPIRYRTPRPPLAYHRVLQGDLGDVDLAGALVLVGLTEVETEVDSFQTPIGRLHGVEVHAALLDTLLGGVFLRRVGPTWDLLIILGVCLATGGLAHGAGRARAGAGWGVVVALAYAGLALALFRAGMWLPWVGPLSGTAFTFGLVSILKTRQIRRLLRQFVEADQVGEMMHCDQATRLGGREQPATVFFTDIRGYTTLSEGRPPIQVMDILNEYHSRVGEIYARHGGAVMTYQGDAQIVLFRHDRAGAARAVAAAVQAGLEMQQAVAELRQGWGLKPGERFEVGVGICTGLVSVALVGSEEHKQFTVLGETVREASEVQGLSASLEAPVLLDQASVELAGGSIRVEPLPAVRLKGKAGPVQLYRAVDPTDPVSR